MQIKDYIPALSWIKEYNKDWFRSDLSAGMTVGIMVIPQAMAYALIAGLPPIYGLYAAFMPLLIYAIFGTSRQMSLGPTALIALLTGAGVGALASQGTEEYLQLAILLAFMVGIIQLILGFFKMGFLVNFLSHPVVTGFTSAAAVIIFFSQLKNLLGINLDRTHHIQHIIVDATKRIADTNWISLFIGLGGIAIIVFSRKINKKIPGPLIAVVLGILIVWLLGLDKMGVDIVREVPEGLPAIKFPVQNVSQIGILLTTAIAIALVALMESTAIAKAIQVRHKDYELKSNTEFIAQGLGNTIGSFFQGFPVAGSFSRTAVNDEAGAKTQVSNVITASIIGMTLIFLTPVYYFLPKAILAAVIMVSVVKLVNVSEAKYLWKTDKRDFIILMVTFLVTLFVGINPGIITGIGLSLAMIIFSTTRPVIAELGRIPGTNTFRNIENYKNLEIRDDILVIRFESQLNFANSEVFKNSIIDIIAAKNGTVKMLLLNAEAISDLDSTASHVIHDLYDELKKEKIDFFVSGAVGKVREIMKRKGLTELIGEKQLFLSIDEGIKYFDR